MKCSSTEVDILLVAQTANIINACNQSTEVDILLVAQTCWCPEGYLQSTEVDILLVAQTLNVCVAGYNLQK